VSLAGALLDSAGAGTDGSTTVSSFDAPAVDSDLGGVFLVACVQTTPQSPLVLPAGWTSRLGPQDISYPAFPWRITVADRYVAAPDGPYEDTFSVTGDPTRWTIPQLLLKAQTGATAPLTKGEAVDGVYPFTEDVEDHFVTAELDGTPTNDNALVAFVVDPVVGALFDEGLTMPPDWEFLFESPVGDPHIRPVKVYAKLVEEGEPTEITVHHVSDQQIGLSLQVVEYPLDPVVRAWDIFEADDLLGLPIARLENAKRRWIRSELHGLGEGGFAINRHADEATEDNFAEGNMVKVRIPDCGPDYIDGFFLPGDGDYTLLAAQGGQGREDLTFRGPGALSYLDRALMTPCAFSIPPETEGTWTKIWTSKAVNQPAGVAFDPDEPNFIYVGGLTSRKVKKVNQTTLEVASSSPALWSGTSRYLAGISFDPDDDTVLWALVAPWLAGSGANTQIKRIRRSDWETLDTWDLGSPVKLTDIRVDGDFVWTTRYDTDLIQQRSKSNAANVVDSFTITFKGKLQRKPTGIAIKGTKVAYWFGGDSGGGTGRALIANTSDPDNIVNVQDTHNINAFGGEWTLEGGEQFLYSVSYTEGKTWKHQLTTVEPACADDSGVFHPEQVAPGALAWRVLVEITHADRPTQPVPELSFDFTEAEDSNGTPWPARTSTEEFTWRVGDRAFTDVLARLIPAGVTFDLDVNTMTLHAYVDADFGADRTSATFAAGKVRFAEGTNLAVNGDLGRRDNRGLPATDITVLGDGGVYGSASLAGRYVREGFMQVAGPTTEAVLDAIGDDELARQRLVSDALGFETLWADDELVGKYVPKLHYWKGDLVRVDMVAGEFAYNETDLRVYGTLITERDGGWRSALDLGSAYKIPPPIESIPGQGGADGSSGGGGGSRGTTVITSIPLTVTDDEDVSIPRVTKIIAEGVTSPEAGVAVLPSGSAPTDPPLLEELLTDETDTALVPHPDGTGGVIWGEDAGATGMTPYYIGPGETFIVPEFKQALFAMLIDNEGTLDVEGFLLEVD
jgi:hypothetical protein